MRLRIASVLFVPLVASLVGAQAYPSSRIQNGDFYGDLTGWQASANARIVTARITGTELPRGTKLVEASVQPGSDLVLTQRVTGLEGLREYVLYFDLLGQCAAGGRIDCQVSTSPALHESFGNPIFVSDTLPLMRPMFRFKVPSSGDYDLTLRFVANQPAQMRVDNVWLGRSYYPLVSIERTVAGQSTDIYLKGGPSHLMLLWFSTQLWYPMPVPGWGGRWELSPISMLQFGIGAGNSSGLAQMRFSFPADPGLNGFPIYWQALQIDPLNPVVADLGIAREFGFTMSAPIIQPHTRAWSEHKGVAGPGESWRGAMAFDSKRKVMVYFEGTTGATWEWNGSQWAKVSTAQSPGLLQRAAMAFDSLRGRCVLFGGAGLFPSKRTWEYDGSNWIERQVVNGPAARVDHAMCFDSKRGVTLLYGGVRAGLALSDTWTWDGATWTQLQPANAPSARGGMGLAFDRARERAVLFGGRMPGQDPFNETYHQDTWEWDGSNWSQVNTAGSVPSAREPGQQFAFDATRGRVVLFGGSKGPWPFQVTQWGDVWEWDGSRWLLDSSLTGPAKRSGACLGYDSERKELLLFGGFEGLVKLTDTWSLDS